VRRRRVIGFSRARVVSFAVVALALDVALLTCGADGVVPAGAKSYPARIVAVTYDGRLLVASAEDGHALRLLATDANAAGGLAVSPDGSTVYYARDTRNGCANGDPITAIAAISVAGGNATDLVTNVRFPAVSPDGRYLAFTGIPNCSDAGRAILVRDLYSTTHVNGSYDGVWGPRSPASPWVGIQSVSWAPDSRHILFTHASSTSTGADDALPRLLDTRARFQTYLDTSPVVRVAPNVVCCYLGTKNALVGSALDAGGFARDVIALNTRTGARVRTLTCCGAPIATDRAGRSLLIHFTDTTHPGGIFRWSPGQRRPTFLGSLLFTAAWLPRS
jgi:WD40-like Beta Propeller Repeat